MNYEYSSSTTKPHYNRSKFPPQTQTDPPKTENITSQQPSCKFLTYPEQTTRPPTILAHRPLFRNSRALFVPRSLYTVQPRPNSRFETLINREFVCISVHLCVGGFVAEVSDRIAF